MGASVKSKFLAARHYLTQRNIPQEVTTVL